MRDKQEIIRAQHELETLSAKTAELIPENVDAIRATLSWVLDEEDELPKVIPEK